MKNKKAWSIWKIWSTGIVIICALIIIFLVVMIIIGGDDNSILLNWGVYLPKPQSRKNIINTAGKDGERLDIYMYNKEEIDEVIRNDYITLINESNIKEIENYLNKFKEFFNYKEEEIFNKNINKEALLTNGNYFAIISRECDNRTWLLLIVDSKTNIMYCFGNY